MKAISWLSLKLMKGVGENLRAYVVIQAKDDGLGKGGVRTEMELRFRWGNQQCQVSAMLSSPFSLCCAVHLVFTQLTPAIQELA